MSEIAYFYQPLLLALTIIGIIVVLGVLAIRQEQRRP